MSAPNEATTRSLVRKLAEVMGEVDRVPKNGRNEFHKYDYATESDIVDAVRAGLASRRVLMLPNVVHTEWTTKGGKERICTITYRFTFHDGDSGESLSFDVLGEGQDSGDKATYKAFTGAVKYAILKTFLIPTGDDPEADGDPMPNKAGQRSKPEVPQQRRVPPQQSPTREPGSDEGPDALEREGAAIVAGARKATTQDELNVLKTRTLALPKGGPEYKAAAAELSAAHARISKGAT